MNSLGKELISTLISISSKEILLQKKKKKKKKKHPITRPLKKNIM
jgi:hypothetical protein